MRIWASGNDVSQARTIRSKSISRVMAPDESGRSVAEGMFGVMRLARLGNSWRENKMESDRQVWND
jgi:hypothetical protein